MRILPFLFFLFVVNLQAQILYVDKTATGANDGSSWEDAYVELRDALADAPFEVQIWVAAGTYLPTDDGNLDSSFVLSGRKQIYGGFNGTETAIDQRDIAQNPTICSGDVDDGFEDTHSIFFCHDFDTLIIDGFIIEDAMYYLPGFFTCSGDAKKCNGGGIQVDSPTVDSCLFMVNNCELIQNGAADQGGGISIANTSSFATYIISNSKFLGNCGSERGGGFSLENYGGLDLIIRNCEFLNNYSHYELGIAGGLYYTDSYQATSSRFQVINTIFEGNFANSIGGFYYLSRGTELLIDSCTFLGNSTHLMPPQYAGETGALWAITIGESLKVDINNTLFKNNLTLMGAGACKMWCRNASFRNCVFYNNISYGWAGALYFDTYIFPASSNQITNCSFIGNQGYEAGAILANQSIDTLVNCLFVDNETNNETLVYNYLQDSLNPKYPAVINGLFADIDPDSAIYNYGTDSVVTVINSLFNIDPEIINDYHLAYCSPAINAGDPGVLSDSVLLFDYEGHARFDGKPDIGAIENNSYQISALQSNVTCFNNMDGALDLTILGGIPPYTLNSLLLPDSTLLWGSLGQGQIDILVEDDEGCIREATFTITEPDSLFAYFTVNPASSPNIQDGEIIIDSISGGTPPYEIVWNAGDTNVWQLSNLYPATYSLTILDTNGCIFIAEVNVDFSVSAVSQIDKIGYKLYPNPTWGISTIDFDSDEKWSDLELIVIDQFGRIVKREKYITPPSTISLTLAEFPKGLYFVQLWRAGGMHSVQKVIIQR